MQHRDRLLVWKSWWKRVGLDARGVCCKVSANHQVGVHVVSQVNGEHRFDTRLHLLAGWERLSTKKQWYLPALLSPESVAFTPAPPVLASKLFISVPPLLSLGPFELLPLHWSPEPVSL